MARKDNQMKPSKKLPIIWLIGAALAGIIIASLCTYTFTSNYYKGVLAGFHILRDTDTEYHFIAPLINYTVPKEAAAAQFAPLVDKIKSVVNAQPSGTLTRYSVYFKDLTNGYWTGINENDQYDPASMLKVVAAIATYKQDEDHPGFLASRPIYTQQLADINGAFPFAPTTTLQVGVSYSMPFLIQEMLSDSDNAAKDLLISSISDAELDDIYTDLSVDKPNDIDSTGYTISSLDYSRFFRVLYNGSYLTRDDSNTVLGYLSEATFKDGLVAGVGSSTIAIAHKFGEHVNGENNVATSVELHDCGIIYHPTNPYFLCVMTQGQDETALASFIAKISNTVYTEVNAGYK